MTKQPHHLLKKALLVIDLQTDFVPGGSLPVKKGDQIVPIVNQLLKKDFDVKFATKDWHPADHESFAVNLGKKVGEIVDLHGLQQILWPVHCVQNTPGADFVKGLEISRFDEVFYKGTDRQVDSYSAFFDNGKRKATGLDDALKQRGVKQLFVAGLATDYCVKYSVLDALALGYQTYVIVDACYGVNLQENDSRLALEEMQEAGGHLVNSDDLLK